jgi:hypothetical protein
LKSNSFLMINTQSFNLHVSLLLKTFLNSFLLLFPGSLLWFMEPVRFGQ